MRTPASSEKPVVSLSKVGNPVRHISGRQDSRRPIQGRMVYAPIRA